MKKCKHEVWTIFKELRKKTHKKGRYTRNVNYLRECLQRNCIPKGLNTKNKATYIDEELRNKYTELNKSAITDYLPLLIDWINDNITILNKEIEYRDRELKRVAIESDYLELQNILITEDKRINQKSVDKQWKKLDSLINIDNNEKSNEMNSTNTTHNSIINRTSLFITGNNRRKNKNNTARRKSNWLRPEQRELLEQLSRSKDIVLPEDMFNPINLTDQQLTEDELNVCKLGLKFIPTVKRYDRVKKWMDIQAFKRKVRLYYFHKLEVDDGNISSEGEEIIELLEPW